MCYKTGHIICFVYISNISLTYRSELFIVQPPKRLCLVDIKNNYRDKTEIMNIKHLVLILVACMIAATLGCASLGTTMIPRMSQT